ncbi:MAG: hypothetical protein EX269_16180 [Acidimicrobiales bacterium]|nr:MAG: hypothetical protein EX269_16180 [Acidimicrobiales bacterium]
MSENEYEEDTSSPETGEVDPWGDIDDLGPAVTPTPPPESGDGGSMFLLVSFALVVLAAGAVYLFGASRQADVDEQVALESAESQLQEYDPTEFTQEFDEAPTSIPFEDPPTTTTAPTTTEAPPSTIDSTVTGLDINPDDIAMVFVSRVPGEGYGRAAYIDRDGERHLTQLSCERIDRNANGGICLSQDAGVGSSGRGFILDAALNPTRGFSLHRPSRAAVSPDGSVVAWTGFTLGHSYLAEGEFATLTQLISVNRGLAVDLESGFTTRRDGEPYFHETSNYWGVTFADNDRFFATLGADDQTVIVEGNISTSTMDVKWSGVSCPEISPDGSTIVAKEMSGDTFRLTSIDVETGARRLLGETRMVDDQVEFLDNDTVLYALANEDEGTADQPAFDVWALDLTPGAQPRLLLPFADSPAV